MVLEISRQYQGLQQERIGQALRVNIPAPTGGLNTRDSESLMEATDAVEMKNVFPSQGKVITRKGYTEYATGLNGNVETLAELRNGTIKKFICCNAGEINDVTDSTSISNLKTGLSNSRFQTVSMNANLLMFNGVDTPLVYDGSTVVNSTIHGSGLTASTLTGCNVHKNRLYAWDTDSSSFWYGSTNAIQGVFKEFDLSGVAPYGGNLILMETWNHDGGDGVDDYALFLMSSGTAFLYEGSDPNDANNWSLIGIYKIGEPVSTRASTKIGGDIAIMTKQDFVFFSEVFKNGGAVTSQTKLSGAAINNINSYESNYGWEVQLYPKASTGGWLFFNVPVATNTTYYQDGINTITGAAFQFTNMNARTWSLYDNNLYFGENGSIMKADDSLSDNGSNIPCQVQAAYSDLGSPQEKVVNEFRNTINIDGNAIVNTTVSFDYGSRFVTQDVSTISSGTPWGSPWGSPWSPASSIRNELVITSGEGVALGMKIFVALNGQQLSWYRTDYSVTVNNIL